MISVDNKKWMTVLLSFCWFDQCQRDCRDDLPHDKLTLTRAPITPREVRRKYSKGRVLDVVLRKGYKKSGIWATRE